MVVPVLAHGQHKWKQFYGCVNFPRCRQVIAIER
jgi:ssDNA-binding Zn-finger/Zn-ribbon topoisomerase 1